MSPADSPTDAFDWIGTIAGDWQDAENWGDLTTGASPSSVAPGSGSSVTFDATAIVEGVGTSDSLSVAANTTLVGTFAVGIVDIDNGGSLIVGHDGTLDAGELYNTAPALLAIQGAGALLTAATFAATSPVAIDVDGGGTAIVPTLQLLDGGSIVVADGASALEIGSLAQSEAGTLSVDAGQTLIVAGAVNDGVGTLALVIAPVIDVDGLFEANAELEGALTGSGTVLVNPGQAAVVTASVDPGSTLDFVVASNGFLDLPATVPGGAEITLLGSNAAIAFTTSGPASLAVDAQISGFAVGDRLVVQTEELVQQVSYLSASAGVGTLFLQDANGDDLGSLLLNGNYAASSFILGNSSDADGDTDSDISLAPPCFATGTWLDTPDGAVPVEVLSIGQRVCTLDAGPRRVRWVGHRQIECGRDPDEARAWPIRISADAFGAGRPRRDLYLSPDHAVYAEGVLVPIRSLINGTTVRTVPARSMAYWHVELESHDIVFAEGLPVESYLDTGNRSAFANGHQGPGWVEDPSLVWAATGRASLRISGVEVARLQARLAGAPVPAHVEAVAPATDLAALLDPDGYLARYPDVATAGLEASVHYLGWGHTEGRLPCCPLALLRGIGVIDQDRLVFGFSDLIDAGIDPLEHYCVYGWREGRKLNFYFDPTWYCRTHDVGLDTDPLLHYLLHGERRGLQPGPHFDPAWYRVTHDLGPTQSPLAHYLLHRGSWHVSPHPSFDLAAHLQVNRAGMRPRCDPYLNSLVTAARTRAAPAVEE